jgi:DNA-binding MarR family transcriptional regulator
MKKNKRSASRARIELDAAVLRSFRVIYGSVRQHFRTVQDSCGISGSQLWMLHEVRQAPGIGVSELAARLSIHQSTGSLLVEKLVRAGLITKSRSKADHRRVGLQLSAKGQRCVKRAPGPPEGVLPEAIAGLSRSKLLALHSSLQTVIAELDVRDDQAADTPLSDL